MVSLFSNKGHPPNNSQTDSRSRSSNDHQQPQQQSLLTSPPPYTTRPDLANGEPIVFAETTTTTKVVTTTQTTTHFFSLPLWRRRATAAPTPSARNSIAGPDEFGNVPTQMSKRSASLQVDKDLPPTPVETDEGYATVGTDARTSGSLRRALSPVPSPPARSRSIVDSPFASRSGTPVPPDSRGATASPPLVGPAAQPTMTLARAALGLGLPHVMPQQAAVSAPALEANTVAFVGSRSPREQKTVRPSTSSGIVRRAKSFHKSNKEDGATPAAVEPVAEPTLSVRRRTRGLSLGPFSLGAPPPAPDTAAGDAKGKGKAKGDESHTPPTISRKPSFFSRIRRDSARQKTPTPPVPSSPAMSMPTMTLGLPPVVPLTPFNMDGNSVGNSPPSQLRRAHSDRKHDRTPSGGRFGSPEPLPSPPLLDAVSPTSSKTFTQADHLNRTPRSRRPSTADPSSTSSARMRAQSLYVPPPSTLLPSSLYLPVDSPIKSLPFPKSVPSPTYPKPNRQRSQTNPHRFSLNLSTPPFSSSAPTGVVWDNPNNQNTNTTMLGQRLSVSPGPSPRASLNRPPKEMLKPQTEESPEVYLERLTEAVNKAELASVLASSADPFYASALRTYIGRFQFFNDPLDIALRKLLVDVGLPRETQQIDRVIEAFSSRYSECNPNLFAQDDQAYVLAFSLIMLHTDAFNKSNKRKMTKVDYVKNTRLPGVPSEVLEYFYDNIVFAPFIFIDDPLDFNGQRGFVPEPPTRSMSSIGGPSTPGGSGILRSNKVDPYYLITQGLLDPLRVPTHNHVPWESPYSYEGTSGPWDANELRRAFASAATIHVNTVDDRRYSSGTFFAVPVGGMASPIVAGSATISGSVHLASALPDLPAVQPAPASSRDSWTLTVTKCGVLVRKDEAMEGGRRAGNRKWREWSVVLTGSQLLFFRDTAWAGNFLKGEFNGDVPASQLRPDELFSVRGAVAVYDRDYMKYRNTMRVVMGDRRHILLQATDEHEMNQWIARINYASAFKTAGVRMRPLGMSSQDIELTGIAAAASYLKEVRSPKRNKTPARPIIRRWDGRTSAEIIADDGMSSPLLSPDGEEPERPTSPPPGKLDIEAPIPPQIESGAQFKATFDQVKKDLAAGRRAGAIENERRGHRANQRSRSFSTSSKAASISSPTSPSASLAGGFPSRSAVVRAKVRELDSKLSAVRSQLDADMRFVRNIAILTPFQRATRDRLEAAVQNITKRVMLSRLEIARLSCHREILSADLRAAEQEWWDVKDAALRAATRVLENSCNTANQAPQPTVQQPLNIATPSPVIGDQATSSSNSSARSSFEKIMRSSPRPIPARAVSLERRSSSQTGSFYSAADFAADWSAATSDADASFSGRRPVCVRLNTGDADLTEITPATENGGASSASTSGFPFPPRSSVSSDRRESPVRSLRGSNLVGGSHERFYTAHEEEDGERAEEWNKTQAGKRVSLVKLPSDLRLSSFALRPRRSSREDSSKAP